jgi:hypothetical protein
MNFGNTPVFILLLAAGYLSTVYLLLNLAKQIGKIKVEKKVTL